MDLGGLGELSGGELLERVDGLARRLRETEVEILRAARAHAVINDPGSIPGWQLRAPGGEGTPLVAEFSPATLAGRFWGSRPTPAAS
jgi:hypothetical protein